jgi:carboxyl-terminal processing protease
LVVWIYPQKETFFQDALSYVVRIRADAMSYSKLNTFILITFLGLPFLSSAKTDAPAPLTPGPNDGNIAYITARLLGLYHYSQQPLDTDISEKFFDSYLNAFDPQHVYFLQADVDEFSHYRTNLDVLTLGSHEQADVRPAFKIYQRFLERLRERADYSSDLLKEDHFTFNTDEQVPIDRKNAPYPKNMDEAKKLWRQQLYFQFLQEKLNRETAPDSTLSTTNLADITQTIQHRFDREMRAVQQWDSGDIMQTYLEALAHAYDPHSDYFNFEHAQDFSINMSLALFGIGAELGSEDGYCIIRDLVPGGPAEKSKLLNQNDKIIAVAQGKQPPVDVIDMELDKIVQLIRGTKGTEVRLTIIPASDPKSRKVITLTRAEINLKDQEAKAMLIETPNDHGGTNRLGVIDVPSFYAPVPLPGNAPQATNYVSTDVGILVEKLKQEKVGGIIIDLRNNPGGSLEEAIQFAGLFVTNGPVVQIRSPEGRIQTQGNDDAPDLYRGPLIVLINRFSASASEIVAAALQDYGRALIVGDTSTFGKGTVQNLTPLAPLVWPASASATNDPGTVKITIRKFYRINGTTTQFKGVVPDIILPDVWSYRDDEGESSLPNALAWDTIPAADYNALNNVQPYLDDLQKKAQEQVATNQDFMYVRQDIAELEKLQSQKTDTLNERKAWDDKEKLDKENKARDKEIASRKLPKEKIYEITVANATELGLPPAIKLETVNEATNSAAVSYSSTNDFTAFFHSTNSASALPQHPAPTSDSITATKGPSPVTRVWAPDPMLDETERILQDYIRLWPSHETLIANHQ